MSVKEESQDDVLILCPQDRLDSNTAKALEHLIVERINAGNRRMVLDFTDLAYVSSAGLRVLLVGAKRMKAGNGKLVLCNLSDPVRKVFQLSGFLPILTVVADRPAAMDILAN